MCVCVCMCVCDECLTVTLYLKPSISVILKRYGFMTGEEDDDEEVSTAPNEQSNLLSLTSTFPLPLLLSHSYN